MDNESKEPSAKRKFGRTRMILLSIGTICVAVLIWLSMSDHDKAPKGPVKPQTVTVQTALATRMDIPQYLEGLGTVDAFNTVTITNRVVGELENVAFTEGQDVKEGDLLAQIDKRPYQAAFDLAVATKDKDASQLENAKRDLDRYQVLAPKNLTSKQILDTQSALVNQLEAQVKADEANIDGAKAQLDYTTITSPINGRTGIRLVDVGNNLNTTNTIGIVVVTQLQPISLIFTLPEDALPQVTEAMSHGPVDITALSRDDVTVLDQGTLLLVDNQIDQTTGTIKLKATFPNASNTLWPGQFINARILLQVQHQALTIPSTAAQRGTAGMFVYVVKPDSTLEARPLTTGGETGGNMVVKSGLEEGERVVTSNQYRLQPGTSVHVEPDTIKDDTKKDDTKAAPAPSGDGKQ